MLAPLWFSLRISWRNVLRNWKHSLASLLSITAAFMASVLFQGYLNDISLQYDRGLSQRGMLGNFLIRKEGAVANERRDPWKFSLDPADQDFLESYLKSHAAQVRERVRFLNIQGLISNGRSTLIMNGYGHDVPEGTRVRGPAWEWNTLYGKPLQLASSPASILVGQKLAELLDCRSSDSSGLYLPSGAYVPKERAFKCYRQRVQLSGTTESAQMNAVDPEIVGIVDAGFRELDRQFVQMPLELAQQLMNTRKVSYYSVALAQGVNAGEFMRDLSRAAAARGIGIDVHPWQKDPKGALYRQAISLMGIFRGFVLLLVVAVATLAVANTIMTSMMLRTREIGTLRSLGYRPRHIAWLFSSEGLLLALLGNLIGLALAIMLSLLIGHLGFSYMPGLFSHPIPFRISILPRAYLATFLLLCLIAGCTALIVSRRAAWMRITEALGYH